jgi:hypothetical protein
MQKLAPRFQALHGLRSAVYTGKGIFGSNVREQMQAFAEMLPVKERGMLHRWMQASKGGSIRTLPAETRLLGNRIGGVFYKGIVNDLHSNRTKDLINLTFNDLGIRPTKATGLFAGTIKNAKTRAFDVAIGAHMTKDLLNGPTLGSNLAALAIPTLATAVTTAAAIRYVKKRGEVLYEGYNGNVF